MSTDLTVAGRAERDALIQRIDVLDKVGVLKMIPGNLRVTGTEAVAAFYEVSRDAIYQVVHRNREELDDDGYQVLSRAELTDMLSATPDELGIPRNAGTVALFTRRSVLRIGMLLRDSDVARRVRDYLLDAEQIDLTDPDVALDKIIELATMAKRERAGRLQAEARAEQLAGPAAAYNELVAIKCDLKVGDAAKILSRDSHIRAVGQNRLFKYMHSINWCFRNRDNGRWCAYQSAVDRGWLVEKPGEKYWDQRVGDYRLGDPVILVTPKGLQELHKRLRGGHDGPEQLSLVVAS